ncbi:MAG: phage antirepressor KilAC domain-containing protein [Tannerella sp.]|jgi:prophage antirepressor-like protein|nr:phage antirepressor KilAC domain-containing protein [Tannerella sp.]
MKNEIMIFNYNSKNVRTVVIDGETWFALKDVCFILGIGNTTDTANRLDCDEKATFDSIESLRKNTVFVNEAGFYKVALRSDKPEANKLMRFVTHEVLPSIRRHGGYVTKEKIEELIQNPDTMIYRLTELKKEHEKNVELKSEIAVMKPKADYHDLILQSKSAIPITQIAKDYGYSARAFNELLHDMRIQYPVGKTWVLYAEYEDCGYTKSKTFHISEEKTATHTYWLPAGVLFLYNKLHENGIIPMIERDSPIDDGGKYPF